MVELYLIEIGSASPGSKTKDRLSFVLFALIDMASQKSRLTAFKCPHGPEDFGTGD